MGTTRLRQVALVARDLGAAASQLGQVFGLRDPFHDPGVAEFGLANAVFALGDTFLEVVAPVRAGTTAGRYLDRRGGDGGYMAIFQVPDLGEARRRVARLGVRVVWTVDGPDMAGTHLHPKDVPGAIVSLDWAEPPGSWRWAGPAWAGTVPEHPSGGIVGATIETEAPVGVARIWAGVLGGEVEIDDGAGAAAASVALDHGRQTLRFVTADPGRPPGITEVAVALADPSRPSPAALDVCGVRFVISPAT